MKLIKQLKHITIALVFLSVFNINAQQKLQKTKQTIKANKDVTLNLNISYTNIEIDTWNKNEVQVEAYIESNELTKKELQDILDKWEVKVTGSGANISIATGGVFDTNYNWNYNFEFDAGAKIALEELQIAMAQIPILPALSEMPQVIGLDEMTGPPKIIGLEDMPEMPKIPKLPELPEGVSNISFSMEAYKKDGEKYLEKWSKDYEKKYGAAYKDKMKAWAKEFSKTDFDKYSKEMEIWGEKFGESYGKKMEIWGEKLGKDMEEWGEKFGESFGKGMEEWGEKFGESFGKDMEAWGEKFGEQFGKELEEKMEKHGELLEEQLEKYEGNFKNSRNNKLIKTIKIKMPKDTKLKLNVRHGVLKIVSVINNLKADLSYTTLLAETIDGSETSINASYSPVIVSNWNLGELKLNYVENAQLKLVNHLNLTSNSSNIVVVELTGNAIINGNFGNLEINKIAKSFNKLSMVLENSDAVVTLPKTDFNLQYQGTRTRFQHPNKSTKGHTTAFSTGNLSSNKTIFINAKYSNVIMQ